MPDTEILATSTVQGALALSDILKSNIETNGTTPSFDGEVMIKPDGKTKKGLMLVRVQVKGHIAKTAEELDQETASYSIEIADLENYNRNGGVLFFYVVAFRTRKKIFYRSFTPSSLQPTLRAGEGQLSKAVNLIPLPDDAHSLEEILINHYNDSKVQMSFCDVELPEADFVNVPAGVSYTARYTSIAQNEYEAISHLLGKDLCLYLERPGDLIPTPTTSTLSIGAAARNIPLNVSAGGKQLSDSATVIISEDGIALDIGSILVKDPDDGTERCSFRFDLKGTFRERLSSLRNLAAIFESREVTIGGCQFALDDDAAGRFSSDGFADILAFYEDVAAVLAAFDDDSDFDIPKITEADIQAVAILKAGVVCRKRLRLNDIGSDNAVAGIRFLGRRYLVYRTTGEDGLTELRDFVSYETHANATAADTGGTYPVTKYGITHPSELLDVSNLKPQYLADACIGAGYNAWNCDIANDTVLALLSRFDEWGNADDLEAASILSSWLAAKDNPEQATSYVVNSLQTKYRQRSLTSDDKTLLSEIMEAESANLPMNRPHTVACLAIAGKRKEASAAFKKLNLQNRQAIEAYPINNVITGKARRL